MNSINTDALASPAIMAEIAALEGEAYQRGWQDAIASVIDAAEALRENPPSRPDIDISSAQHGGWTPERRRRHSGQMEAHWQSEERRRQHSETIKAAWQRKRDDAGSGPKGDSP